MKSKLQTIPSNKINHQKWDECVLQHKAPIYTKFIFLNTMANNWVGLVLNDYEAVMPICYRKKIGITYIYTPAFIQQLGWIGKKNIEWELIEKAVLSIVKYGDIMFNHYNDFDAIDLERKTNFIINLSADYNKISSNYKSDLKQNLKKASRENLFYQQSNNVEQAISLYKNTYSHRMNGLTDNDFNNFTQLCLSLQKTGDCFVREVVNSKQELLAIALLLIDENRIYNLANSTTTLGRNTEANHFLIDSILKEFANSNYIFDFEGSDLVGVNSFYKKFGSVNEPYYHWHFNHLPKLIKWLKP